MSENTKIEWCDHTFNPWEGCQKVSPGCDNCYAEARNTRFGGGTAINWGPGAQRRRTSAANWALPKRWNAQADTFMAQHGRRQRVFCASLADVFDNAVDPQWRADLFKLIAETPNLDWLLLTKRIGNVRGMLAELAHGSDPDLTLLDMMPLPNVWIGATIVTQAEADRDIPKLLAVPARVRFLSMEPLLGPVKLPCFCSCGCGKTLDDARQETMDDPGYLNPEQAAASVKPTLGIDWVIVGGESCPGARPMHPEWARSLRDQCKAAGVSFLFKQWGEWVDADNGPEQDAPYEGKTDCWAHYQGGHHYGAMGVDFFNAYPMYRIGKKAAGRLLDGRTWDGFPS